ncbi:MAG: nitroreductase [Bacteroidota bacterium]
MQDILKLIQERRSIFPPQFTDEPIAKKTLEQLLEAANWAPTHKRTEPWRFWVFTGAAKARLGTFLSTKYQEIEAKPKQVKIRKLQGNCQRAAAVIAIGMQRDPEARLPEWEELAATAMAVQNLWLCATAQGLGGYWSSPSLIQYMDEFIALDPGQHCLGFFYLGHYESQATTMERKPIDEKVVWLD